MTNGQAEYKQWLEYADSDYKAAAELLKTDLHNIVCFHAQQTIEKFLKAYLVLNGINPPKINSIILIVNLCMKFSENFAKFKNDAKIIDMFYIPSRYPNAPLGGLPDGIPSKNDAQKAFEIAQKIRDFVLEQIDG
ncbi:HEPN domain-containing protein [Thermoanaerobacter uzonensis]|uniref:HEPN domain-containing protein n=1 Tax=Thermoanaerobacter uzonensis TaxID=447593 RepID=UPI003D766BAE